MTDQLRTRDLIGQTTAEVALLGITLATAIGMARLFTSGDFLWRIIVVIVVAHVLNAAIRHLRWPGWIAALVILASGVLTISWLYLGDTMTFGVPTGATLDLVRSVLQEAFAPFNSLVAPVEITAGFELTLAAAAWILATFADAAAFRGEAPVQAVIPCLASFLFTSILAARTWWCRRGSRRSRSSCSNAGSSSRSRSLTSMSPTTACVAPSRSSALTSSTPSPGPRASGSSPRTGR